MFALDFYQKEPVGINRQATTYQLYFTNGDGNLVSDVQKVIADKTEANIQERTFRRTFNLKAFNYSSADIYYLVIDSGQNLQREEFHIDIAFSVNEFDFFG